MTSHQSIDVEGLLTDHLATAKPDLLRSLLSRFIHAVMSADADVVCRAAYGQRTRNQANSRNGYRRRGFDTRVGTIELAIPKLRFGTYYPDWLLQRPGRAEHTLARKATTCYLLGVSVARVEGLVESLGAVRLSKAQVVALATKFNAMVQALRTRPLDGPYRVVSIDSRVLAAAGDPSTHWQSLIATGVNVDGSGELLTTQVRPIADQARWFELLDGLVARGLSGVRLVISEPDDDLSAAIQAVLPGATWRRSLSDSEHLSDSA